jgi:hypothetical protein
MNTWKNFSLTLVAIWAGLSTGAYGQTTSRLTSSFLARGEQALLEVAVAGGQASEIPEISPVPNISIVPSGRPPRSGILPGRRMEIVYEFIISGYETGKHVIPPIEVLVNGIKTRTEPLDFVIFNPDELQWSEVQSGGKIIRYASSFRCLNESPFENETVTTEIKVFVPEELAVVDWGIPDFERDGVTAWRFQPSPVPSRVNLLGMRYVSIAYPSTITPTRTGKVGIGPAKVRLTTREVVMDPSPRWVNPEIYLQVPKLEITSKPLPADAPEGFENAVGNFRISASTTTTEVQEGDPITVDLVVTGSGNLDTLRPPKLAETKGWKIYGTTTEQRGDERRELAGNVIFHQSIRPLELKPEIPSFRLIYFDPKSETYKSLSTDPIALQMTPGAAPTPIPQSAPQTLPIPLERMTDILAVLRPAQLTLPANPSERPAWLVHAIGGMLALGLLAKALWMHYAPRLRQNPDQLARARELREIESSKSTADIDFLKSTGSFIERWLGTAPDTEIQAVLAERDAVCFRSEKPNSLLDSNRRKEILKLLRKAAMAVIFTTTFVLPPPARAADTATQALEAYESAKYDDALKLWMGAGSYDQLSADTLYNIGNACYRSGSPGQAALYYRRALVRDSGHQEARQNLRFIERKYGAISVNRPEYQYAIAKFPLATWQTACWSGVWLCGLALLVFPATRSGARLRGVAIGVLVIGPVLVFAGALGWRYFPDDSEFAPVAKQAVIIAEKVALHTDAARTSPEVIDAPPGSLCEIIRESGRWAYVAFASKTRGWVPVEAIEKVTPDKAPAPPKFRKPKADGKTA